MKESRPEISLLGERWPAYRKATKDVTPAGGVCRTKLRDGWVGPLLASALIIRGDDTTSRLL